MVKLTKIYTGGGDGGETSLASGERVAKHAPRMEACGTVDEANATIGIARACAPENMLDILAAIQNDLFDVGADLTLPDAKDALRITPSHVEALEKIIDQWNAELAPLDSFVLPGGSAAAATLHFARTVARRAERTVTALGENEPVNPHLIRYLNRLSDVLFVLARHANDRGRDDVLWKPGGDPSVR
ncbi:MAG: cob(I)yrinic acid a,c-diamide adenosyltransferase [Alphaproteobacteria bacterium]|nr:cob(I)yrinic acid a,c-diamide adenosyltransferase [Alphaproteobacteria bacterium]